MINYNEYERDHTEDAILAMTSLEKRLTDLELSHCSLAVLVLFLLAGLGLLFGYNHWKGWL